MNLQYMAFAFFGVGKLLRDVSLVAFTHEEEFPPQVPDYLKGWDVNHNHMDELAAIAATIAEDFRVFRLSIKKDADKTMGAAVSVPMAPVQGGNGGVEESNPVQTSKGGLEENKEQDNLVKPAPEKERGDGKGDMDGDIDADMESGSPVATPTPK